MYKVLLVDDEILVREAISAKIEWGHLGFELVGDCENGKAAIEFFKGKSCGCGVDGYLYAISGRNGA